MHRLIERFHLDRYLSSSLILGIDLGISFLASLCSISMIRLCFPHLSTIVWFPALWLAAGVIYSLLLFYLLKTYHSVIRHSTLHEMGRFVAAVLGKELLLTVTVALVPGVLLSEPCVVGLLMLDTLLTLCLLVVFRIGMVVVYDILKNRYKYRWQCQRILVYGTGDKSVGAVTRLRNSPYYKIVGFLTGAAGRKRHRILEYPVYGFDTRQDVEELCDRHDIDAVLFSSEEEARAEQERLLKYATEGDLRILITPPLDEIIDGKLMKQSVREIKIEDLLGRPEIKISMDEIVSNFRGKTVLVTGAAGSIGAELCRQLANFGVEQLILFDNAETPMHNIRLELEERYPALRFVPVIGDVRIPARLDFVFKKYRPQIVFHAAAYKHVPLMEENPCEAVLTNVAGTRNVADKCLVYDVEKMVMISTDKAVNPTNIMGCTKRLAEIYVQSLGLAIEQGRVKGKTRFVTTRFGNVLGSNGSVIPRFREQIAKGGPVTVTHPEITRFFMTIPEACRLVMEAATISSGNQIVVFDMGESVKIAHLAERMIELAGLVPGKDIRIAYTGLRPGEKLYEEVLFNTENTRPTSHDRIRIAKVRECDYEHACKVVDELDALSRVVEIPEVVRLMKRTVPEFRSKNSSFEEFDAETETINLDEK